MTETAPLRETMLAERMATRLCHDLAGLCGVLLGALELAAEERAAEHEALLLARDAAGDLAARLRLLRAAWGQASEPHDAASLRALAAGLPGAARLRLDFAGVGAGMLPPPAARLALAALLLGAEALPLGGTLSLAAADDGRAGLTLAIAGRRAAWPDGLGGAAAVSAPRQGSGDGSGQGPRHAPGLLLAALAEAGGMRLELAEGVDRATLAIVPRRRGAATLA